MEREASKEGPGHSALQATGQGRVGGGEGGRGGAGLGGAVGGMVEGKHLRLPVLGV